MNEVDKDDPKYKLRRRKAERWLALINSAAMVTADEDDDEVAYLFSEIVRENFDAFYAIKWPKK